MIKIAYATPKTKLVGNIKRAGNATSKRRSQQTPANRTSLLGNIPTAKPLKLK